MQFQRQKLNTAVQKCNQNLSILRECRNMLDVMDTLTSNKETRKWRSNYETFSTLMDKSWNISKIIQQIANLNCFIDVETIPLTTRSVSHGIP